MSFASKISSWKRYWTGARPNNIGILLLGIWLIAAGVMQLFQVSFPASGIVIPALAIAAGLILVLDVSSTALFLGALLALSLAVIAYLLR